jgi:hypothetical protein
LNILPLPGNAEKRLFYRHPQNFATEPSKIIDARRSSGDSSERFFRDGIHRLALSTPIVMIYAVALVVTPDQARAHQFRYGSADVRQGRATETLIDCLADERFGLIRVCGHRTANKQVRANSLDHGSSPGIVVCDRHQGVAQPFPDGY